MKAFEYASPREEAEVLGLEHRPHPAGPEDRADLVATVDDGSAEVRHPAGQDLLGLR